jgi:hypothetical protein
MAMGPVDEYIKGTKRTKSVATLLREIIVLIVQNNECKRNDVGQWRGNGTWSLAEIVAAGMMPEHALMTW